MAPEATTTARWLEAFAAAWRRLPSFRGKGWIGRRLHPRLVASSTSPVKTIRMWDGSLVRVDIRSRTEQNAFWTADYDRATVERFCRAVAPGSTVLDVGANVGFYTVPLARRLRATGGLVIAIEPDPQNARRLGESLAVNGLTETVRIVIVALGATEGEALLATERSNGATTGNAVLATGSTRPQGVLVPARVTPLDVLAQELDVRSCELVKVDIEGGEPELLEGARRFLERHRPIVYGEFSRAWIAERGRPMTDVFALIRELGYDAYAEVRPGRFEPVGSADLVLDRSLLLAPRGESAARLTRYGVRVRR